MAARDVLLLPFSYGPSEHPPFHVGGGPGGGSLLARHRLALLPTVPAKGVGQAPDGLGLPASHSLVLYPGRHQRLLRFGPPFGPFGLRAGPVEFPCPSRAV